MGPFLLNKIMEGSGFQTLTQSPSASHSLDQHRASRRMPGDSSFEPGYCEGQGTVEGRFGQEEEKMVRVVRGPGVDGSGLGLWRRNDSGQ
jgi:hypothetical protein